MTNPSPCRCTACEVRRARRLVLALRNKYANQPPATK